MYSLVLALKRIKNRLPSYLLIILEITVGIALLIISATLLRSIDSRLDEVGKDRRNRMYYLEGGTYSDFNFNVPLALAAVDEYGTIDDYNYVKSNYEGNVNALQYKVATVPAKFDGEEKDILLFYTTPEFFELVFDDRDTELSNDKMYVGEEALRAIKEGLITDLSVFYEHYERFENFDEKTNKVTFLDGQEFEVTLYKSDKKERIIYNFFDIKEFDFDYAIILPSSAYNEKNADGVDANSLGLDFENQDPHLMIELINHFQNKYSQGNNMSFNYINVMSIWEFNVLEFREIGEVLRIISTFCIIMVASGLFAYNLMQFNKRKREIAIKKSIGCGDGKLLFECLLESCVVTFAGGVIGSICGVMVIKRNIFKSSFFDLKLEVSLIVLFIFVSILIGVATNVYIMINMRKLKPIQILKDL